MKRRRSPQLRVRGASHHGPGVRVRIENFASLSTRADETKEIRGPDGDGVAFAAAANDEYAGLSFSFAAACREADEKQRPKPVDQAIERARRLLTDDVALESAWHEISRRDTAAVSTVEALVYALRTDGTAAIATNRMRLLELSPKQLENVIVRLSRMRPAHPSINDHLLELLTELLP